jgi:uncharacterized protein (TIGR02996 family)
VSNFANLMKAVVASPADDLPRLVLADWFDENGEPERAEFIRVQIELHRFRGDKRDYRQPLDRRERALWKLLPRTPFECRVPGIGRLPVWIKTDGVIRPGTVVRRGFVAEFCGDIRWWHMSPCRRCRGRGVRADGGVCKLCHGCRGKLGIGRQMVAEHPIERVWITGFTPVESVPDRWLLPPLPNDIASEILKAGPMHWPSFTLAHSALSAALVAWASSVGKRPSLSTTSHRPSRQKYTWASDG